MFKRFFGHDEEEEEVFETVDPVLEQRRKEKFSAPLIYNDDIEEEMPVKKEPVKTVEQKKSAVPVESNYRMTQIISPITGIKETKTVEKKVVKPKPKKIKKENDDLIPIMSPFYGYAEREEPVKKVIKKEPIKSKDIQDEFTVEQNLRNIAHIVEEENDNLKIIEERTGEFKLDLKNEDSDSFIDEIDDSMSLDELMSLYEKKFKD